MDTTELIAHAREVYEDNDYLQEKEVLALVDRLEELLAEQKVMREQRNTAQISVEKLTRVFQEVEENLGGSFVASDGYLSYAVTNDEKIREILSKAGI